jgi:putative phage-type endonuclease
MKIISFPKTKTGSPDSPEWHAWRSNGIGGSDAPVIAAENGLCDRAAWMKGVVHLWLLKTGKRQADQFNWAMARGKHGELPARIAYEEQSGNAVEPIFGEMESHPFVRASFDGVSLDASVITEIKCPSKTVHEMAKNKIVVSYYQPQLAHQGLVAWGEPGVSWQGKYFHFVSYIPETGELAWFEFPASLLLGMAERLLELETQFWTWVVNDVQPCGDLWVEGARRFLQADRDFEVANSLREESRDEMLLLLGNKTRMEGAGVLAYRTETSGRINYAKAAESLIKQYGLDLVFLESFRGSTGETSFVKAVKSVETAQVEIQQNAAASLAVPDEAAAPYAF